MIELQGKKVGEYDFNYKYNGTDVTHKILEYYNAKEKIRMVTTEKETRNGYMFVKLPNSVWITKDGYPPLATDGALQHVFGKPLTLFFAGLPTVQSKKHIDIFDGEMRKSLKKIGLDYDKLSKGIKESELTKDIPITGFLYFKRGKIDKDILDKLLPKVLNAYVKVLESEPAECPVDLWRERIKVKQAVTEYYLFKEEGFDVPLSAQRAFFTMVVDKRELPDKEDPNVKMLIDLIKGD